MNQEPQIEAHQTLQDIKYLMENSSKFLSLSGLSGVLAGIYALIGTTIISLIFKINPFQPTDFDFLKTAFGTVYNVDAIMVLIAVALGVLVTSILTSFFMSKSPSRGSNKPAIKLLINLSIPLIFGGLLMLIALQHYEIEKVIPYSLIFYGLALINASKYTLGDIRSLGIIMSIIGTISYIIPQYGILLWSIGFGLVHIIYGSVMYFKYGK